MNRGQRTYKSVVAGLFTGAANGIFGGGGGMVAVPLLKNYLDYDEKRAHATAILLIFPISLASAITYIINGYFDLNIILPAAVGSVAGGLLGAELLDKLPSVLVGTVFVAVMFAAGVRMLF